MSDTSLFLSTGSLSISTILQPVVLLSILEHYVKRQEGQDRVIGTLLGIANDGTIEIRNSYPVPHSETDQVSLNAEFQRSMYELHTKANPKDILVGWYATGPDMDDFTVLLQEFYAKELKRLQFPHPAVFLWIPTPPSPSSDSKDADADAKEPLSLGQYLKPKSYISVPLALPTLANKPLGTLFQPLRLTLLSHDPNELIALESMVREQSNEVSLSSIASEIGNLHFATRKVLQLLDVIGAYLDRVVAEEVKPNNKFGRFLANIINSLPKIDPGNFEKLFGNGMQDLLMIIYLTDLIRAQLAISEKLQGI